MRSKKEREKIKAREEEFPYLSPQFLSTFHRFLYFAPLSTIRTLGTGYVRILVQGQCNVISNQFVLLKGTLKH